MKFKKLLLGLGGTFVSSLTLFSLISCSSSIRKETNNDTNFSLVNASILQNKTIEEKQTLILNSSFEFGESNLKIDDLKFQWYKDGIEIDGAVNKNLNIPNISMEYNNAKITLRYWVDSKTSYRESNVCVLNVTQAQPNTPSLKDNWAKSCFRWKPRFIDKPIHNWVIKYY